MKFSMKIFLMVIAMVICLPVLPAAAAESDGVRVGVLRFESKVEGVADRQAEIITDIFTNVLYGAKNIQENPSLKNVDLDKLFQLK
jgi:hypothetical protein